MSVLVHKAVEPDALTRKGKARLAAMIEDGAYIVQPKYDGVYCQIVDGKAYSRTGEHLTSVPEHVLKQFAGLEGRYIGELWKQGVPHSDINGAARKKKPVEWLELWLFDVVGGEAENLPYVARYELLQLTNWQRGVSVAPNLNVVQAGWAEAETLDYLYEIATQTKAKASAYDGLMLKDSMGLFVPGSGKDGGAIKIKPRASGDFRVVGTTEGLGNRAGGIGALIVDLGGGVTCEVGTGLNIADVHDRGAAYFVGQIVEVEYLSITKDGRLREPVYKSVRFDKEAADTLACNVGGAD